MVRNIHDRYLPVPAARVGGLIDSLASRDDRLWPHHQWPAMRLDRPLGVGATGGHGPVRYAVEEYQPGSRIRFRFQAPAGFCGYHEYEVLPITDHGCRLRHRLHMTTRWPAWMTWPLFYRPLHNALIEDSLDTATRSLGLGLPRPSRWSLPVRALRSLIQALRAWTRSPRRRGPDRSDVQANS